MFWKALVFSTILAVVCIVFVNEGLRCIRRKNSSIAPITVVKPIAKLVTKGHTPTFKQAGVSEAIFVEEGDWIEFRTSGVWTGYLIFEESLDNINWTKMDKPECSSAEDRNFTYTNFCWHEHKNIECNLVSGAWYRWRMVVMKTGACNYYWIKR